jgi:hypothetical protein
MSSFNKISKWWIGFLSVIIFQIPLLAQSGINDIGSFEQSLPSYWTKGAEPDGSTLSWATDEFRSMGRSLKIEKNVTTEAAMWESENMCDLWSEKHFKNVDIKFGLYYMTSGVNTNPANDDQKWYVSYSFYDSAGVLIGEKKFDLDQSAASTSGWVADTTAVGEIVLPEDSWKTIIRFVGGKDATGTVWTDDYLFVGRDGWAGQDWNTQVGVPTGWFYWMPPIGGNDGVLDQGYENTVVTNEEAYDGSYSLKFDIPEGTHDGFVGTRRYALNDVIPGDNLRISDWTQFYTDVIVPDPPSGEETKAISVRLHPLGRFSGTVYMDVLEVKKTDVTGVENAEFLPAKYNLFQNYPNPFNPTTTISYSIPNVSYVTLKIYNILGREVRTLINSEQNIGIHNVQWNGDNNYGSKVSSGIYLYKIEAGNFTMTKKLVLLK